MVGGRVAHGVLGCGGSNVSVGGGGRVSQRGRVSHGSNVYRNVYRKV